MDTKKNRAKKLKILALKKETLMMKLEFFPQNVRLLKHKVRDLAIYINEVLYAHVQFILEEADEEVK